jgi:SnoaL-like protein
MDDLWAHEPYVTAINAREKAVTIGWDAVTKNLEGIFVFWSEFKSTGGDAPLIHINGGTAWVNGTAIVSGKTKQDGNVINLSVLKTVILEKRGDRWLIVSWNSWRAPE